MHAAAAPLRGGRVGASAAAARARAAALLRQPGAATPMLTTPRCARALQRLRCLSSSRRLRAGGRVHAHADRAVTDRRREDARGEES
jgi:hypothetical protein